MPTQKLSAITAATGPPALTDQFVGVVGGTADRLWTAAQVAAQVAPGVGYYNVRAYGATGNGVTDDTAAIATAIAAAVAAMSDGLVGAIFFPPGQYLISSAPWGTFRLPIRILGAGTNHTFIVLTPSFSGDVFGWSECWGQSAYTTTGINLSGLTSGASAVGFTIVGNRTTSNTQNGLVLYDRNDDVFMLDLGLHYLTGHALFSGILQNSTQSYMRESVLMSIRCRNNGNPGVPTVEFNSIGTGDGTNEIEVIALSIFGPKSTGLVIASQGANASQAVVRDMRFTNLRIEGLQGSAGGNLLSGDLLQVGSTTQTGLVNNVSFVSAYLLDSYTNGASISFNATSGSVLPYQCYFQGNIGGGAPLGNGIVINAGRQLFFKVFEMNTPLGTNLVTGTSSLVHSNCLVDGQGQESTWTTSIGSGVTVFAPATLQSFP